MPLGGPSMAARMEQKIKLMKGKVMSDDERKVWKSIFPEARKTDVKVSCEKFFETDEFKSGDKDYLGYEICCNIYQLCPTPFYTQIWFFAVCGGVALLLLIVVVVLIYFCCWKKKKMSGTIPSRKKSNK